MNQPQMIRANAVKVIRDDGVFNITVNANDPYGNKVEFIMVDPLGRFADVITQKDSKKEITRYFKIESLVGDYTEPEAEKAEMNVVSKGDA